LPFFRDQDGPVVASSRIFTHLSAATWTWKTETV